MMGWVARWLADEIGSPGTRHALVTLAGSLGRLGLGFVASLLIARGLGPAGYGLIAVLSLVVSVLDTVADFGLTYTAIHAVARRLGAKREPPDSSEGEPAPDGGGSARALATGYWSLTLLLNVAMAGLGVALAGPIARLVLARPEAESSVRLVVLGLVSVSSSGACLALLQASRRFGRMALVQVAGAGSYLVGLGTLAALGRLSVQSVVVLGVLNPVVVFLLGLRLLPRGLLVPREGFTPAARGAWSELARFSRWLWLSAILSLLASQLDLALVGRWLPATEVGLYALALNLATKLDIVNQARFTVLLPATASLGTTADLRAHARRLAWRSARLAAPLVLAVPLAEPFVRLTYGPDYVGAVPALLVLVVAVIFDLVTTPLLLLAFPLNAPRVLAASDALRVLTLGGLAVVLVPGLGPVGAALAKLGAKLVGAAFTLAALYWIGSRRRSAAGAVVVTT